MERAGLELWQLSCGAWSLISGHTTRDDLGGASRQTDSPGGVVVFYSISFSYHLG